MVIFWTTPRHVKIAKLVVIIWTVIYLALVAFNVINGWSSRVTHDNWILIVVFLAEVVLESLLMVVVVMEIKWFILIAVIILGIGLVLFMILINWIVLGVAVQGLNGQVAQWAGITTHEDLFALSLIIEGILLFVLLFHFIRFYAVLTVYRWTKLPRIPVGRQGITVHTHHLQ